VHTSAGSCSRSLRFLLAAALCVGLLGHVAGANGPWQRPKEKPPPALIPFAGTLKQACARAVERNVPIVAIALLDEESDNVAARTELLASAEIATLSVHSVLFFSNVGAHKPREVVETVDGVKRTRTVCSVFATATCKEHQQHWDDIYNQFNENGELRCPQVLVLKPDGTLAGRVSPGLRPEVSAIVALEQETQAKLGRGLDDSALATVKDALARAARAELAGKYGSMWRAFGEVLAVAPDGPRAQGAKDGQKRALEGFAKQRDAAAAKLAQDNGLEGYLALEELARDWSGTDQAAELTRTMKRAEKEPALRDALAKKKREEEAQALWNEAEAANAAKHPEEAERKLRLLLKKYPGTPAYQRAAKAHPDWVGG
jgi:hypothetical protein